MSASENGRQPGTVGVFRIAYSTVLNKTSDFALPYGTAPSLIQQEVGQKHVVTIVRGFDRNVDTYWVAKYSSFAPIATRLTLFTFDLHLSQMYCTSICLLYLILTHEKKKEEKQQQQSPSQMVDQHQHGASKS